MNRPKYERAQREQTSAGAEAIGMLEALIGSCSRDLAPHQHALAKRIVARWNAATDEKRAAIAAPADTLREEKLSDQVADYRETMRDYLIAKGRIDPGGWQ